MKKLLLIALLVLFSFNSAYASEQISKRKVKLIQLYESTVIFVLESPISNTDGCSHSNAKWSIGLDISTEGGRQQYATVLSARVSNSEIGFGVNGCINWGNPTVAKVYRVDL